MAECRIDLGTIDLYGRGKRYKVIVNMNLTEKEPNKMVFSANADVLSANSRSWERCGQCLDSINKKYKTFSPNSQKLWKTIYRLWKNYHLNDMHAGTEKQEKILKERFGGEKVWDFNEACRYLQKIGLYEDNGYRYGSGWLYREIPECDLNLIKSIIDIFGEEQGEN